MMQKLEEVRAELYDEATSSEEKSPIQVGDDSMLPIDDDLAGEEVKIERTKGEKVKDIVSLSRTTPMDGKSNTEESVYVTDGTLKAPTISELQGKLDDFKKNNIKKDEYDESGKLIDLYYDEHGDEYMGEAYQDTVKELYGMIDDADGSKEFTDKAIVLAQKLMDNLQQMKDEGINYRE